MTVREAINMFIHYLQMNHKNKTIDNYKFLLDRFETAFADCAVDSVSTEEIFQFLEGLTKSLAKNTRRLRYAQLKAFYNFIIVRCSFTIKNPCDVPLLKKSFRTPRQAFRKILDKEIVDEMIYKTHRLRDRLILELQARCALRIGELLNIRASDISERTITLRTPKSGRDTELAFMPENISKKLKEYIDSKQLQPEDRVFPICYSTARSMIKRLGAKLNVRVAPHDLRRYSATYASRNGVPLEVVSKVILRHQDLKTIQVYLGRISDVEAIRWMDVLHGR
jgi:integrase/recombinase XerD